jgi:hypothetical protein
MSTDNTEMSPESMIESIPLLRAALNDLPVAQRDEISDQLLADAMRAVATGNKAALVDRMKSILATARLHRNPRYVKALAEEADLPEGEPVAVDIETMLAARAAR